MGDVGGNIHATSVEELDLVVRGANYGWPLCDGGPCGAPGVTNPVVLDTRILAATQRSWAGSSTRARSIRPVSQGSYFFADYRGTRSADHVRSTGTVVTGVFNFQPPDGTLDSPTVGDPVQLQQGPDGPSTTST